MPIKTPPYTLTNESINIVLNGRAHTVPRSATNFVELRRAILEERWDEIEGFLTANKTVEQWSGNRFVVKDGSITFEDEKLHPQLTKRIMDMVARGEDPNPFFKFWGRLKQNPSNRSVEQLFPFMEHSGIPLTPDGCFLAYKGLNPNYRDVHSNTVDNRPGVVNKMPRNKISDDPRQGCHYGYHVGALAYAQSFGKGTVVVCKVDPKDVVCVPYDHSHQKMRVCEYKVIGNHATKLDDSLLNEDFDVEAPTTPNKTKGRERPPARVLPEGSPSEWSAYEEMDFSELMQVGIMDLRPYAAKGLNIVGASKIPGGKLPLVEAILETR